MRIALLTSSRADFGIYLPLLEKLSLESSFSIKIIAFGSHFSVYNGSTYKDIAKHGFDVDYEVHSTLITDDPDSIATSLGLTVIKFSSFWKMHKAEFDLVIVLGDRYEMFAAVIAGIPHQIRFAHIHGGETTIGAIDNIFRHSITLSSAIHFCSTENHAAKIRQLTHQDSHVYNVGALSLDNLLSIRLKDIKELKSDLNVDLARKTILVTLHPETVDFHSNAENAKILVNLVKNLKDYQVIITMPNMDTDGSLIRKEYEELASESGRVFLIEHLGTINYLSVMQHVCFLLGNTSSGIIEAASFGKFVIDLGSRQKGRDAGNNVFRLPFDKNAVLQAISSIERKKYLYEGPNIYYNGGAATKILNVLKGEI